MQETENRTEKPELTSTQVARQIGVTPVTVRVLVERGQLRGWRIGTRYKFSHAAVAEFLSRSARPLTI